MIKKAITSLCIVLFGCTQALAQHDNEVFSAPFDFGLLLSGNFGELRSNHFHSGLDFKTQGVTGKPIRCVADGYISRASVQPGGYGLALYVMHDNGYMTVYGHLDRFPAAVDSIIRDTQYRNECFAVDISFDKDEFRVQKGEILAHAGNSGYSFGPHLHFEVRDSTGNELYDPMKFYADMIKDSRPPVASKIAMYPFTGAGVVDAQAESKTYDIKGGIINDTIEAWGKVGVGIMALDYMDDTNNKYGVYRIELYVDDSLRYSSTLDNFSFSENRLINAWTDYPRHIDSKEWFQRMFILENNPLRALKADGNRGWIEIDEERPYRVECRLSDYHGNSSCYRFYIYGKKQELPEITGTHKLYWFMNNCIECDGMSLDIPRGELFESIMLDVEKSESTFGFSSRYTICKEPVPLWHKATLAIKTDSLPADPSKLFIRRITAKGGNSVGGKYRDGWIKSGINSLGTFEVAIDTVPPRLKPVNEKRWARNRKVVFVAEEKETSIKDFRGSVDGKFALFSYSSKNGRIVLDLKREKIARGKRLIRLEVTDACGNTAVYEKHIDFK